MAYKAGQTKSTGTYKGTAGGIKGQKIGGGTTYKAGKGIPKGAKPKGS